MLIIPKFISLTLSLLPKLYLYIQFFDFEFWMPNSILKLMWPTENSSLIFSVQICQLFPSQPITLSFISYSYPNPEVSLPCLQQPVLSPLRRHSKFIPFSFFPPLSSYFMSLFMSRLNHF